jgi:hypothetical protein
MTENLGIQRYERFLAAKQYTMTGSEDIGIAPCDFGESGAATQSEKYVAAVYVARPRERVHLVKPVLELDTGWTFRSVVTLGGQSGQGVSDELDRAKAENGKRLRLKQAIDELGRLIDGWAGEDSVAPSKQAIEDAQRFASLLPDRVPEPTVCAADDGEILIDWTLAGKKAVVGLEGDGRFGYALYSGGYYKPGSEEGDLSAHDLPSDLKRYLQSMKMQ